MKNGSSGSRIATSTPALRQVISPPPPRDPGPGDDHEVEPAGDRID
jgi:hypothetical protein